MVVVKIDESGLRGLRDSELGSEQVTVELEGSGEALSRFDIVSLTILLVSYLGTTGQSEEGV